MNHTEKLTRYTANFVDALACNGLRHVVISPGSRSTPLAVLFAAHNDIQEWIHVDERAAAFFALGIAKEKKQAVALVCTSGTAAANYMPALAEAYYARVPLIVLTADRPHELRDIGASQTMNQINMYANFVKKTFEMAPPSAEIATLHYVRNRAKRALQIATADPSGPVHLNFPFQEPLMPNLQLEDLFGKRAAKAEHVASVGRKRLSAAALQSIAQKLSQCEKGVIVCGPQTDEALAPVLVALSKKLQIPLLADPLSQIRNGPHEKVTLITTYDAIFKDAALREALAPDYILRFGAMPISKHYSFYVQEHSEALQFVVDSSDEVREPTNQPSEYIVADSVGLCEDLLNILPDKLPNRWLKKWQTYEQIAIEELNKATQTELSEGAAIGHFLKQLPDYSRVFVANSMPVRDVDTFLLPSDKQLTIYANRGLSGIDGTIATALGVAAATQEKVYLIIGDLSFYHDLTSLQLAKHYQLNVTILLVNNDGGGIFSFLPQAEDATYFEHLFGTPLALDFHHAVAMFNGTYDVATNLADYQAKLRRALTNTGLHVLEIKTDRRENVLWHRGMWQKITQRLKAYEATSEIN